MNGKQEHTSVMPNIAYTWHSRTGYRLGDTFDGVAQGNVTQSLIDCRGPINRNGKLMLYGYHVRMPYPPASSAHRCAARGNGDTRASWREHAGALGKG